MKVASERAGGNTFTHKASVATWTESKLRLSEGKDCSQALPSVATSTKSKFVQTESSEKFAYSLPRCRRTKGAKPLKFVQASAMQVHLQLLSERSRSSTESKFVQAMRCKHSAKPTSACKQCAICKFPQNLFENQSFDVVRTPIYDAFSLGL